MKIRYSQKFAKAYKNLPHNVKLLMERKEAIFRRNQFASQLRTHKLKGELSEFYAFSISYQYRIIFHFEVDGDIVLDTVGTHEVYR